MPGGTRAFTVNGPDPYRAQGGAPTGQGGGPSYGRRPGAGGGQRDGGQRDGGQRDGGQPYPAYQAAGGYGESYEPGGYGSYNDDAPYGDDSYGEGNGYGPYADDNVAVYRAGQSSVPPAGPRLHWKELLSGIVLRPGQTFWQTRDHTVWGPALIVTFVYGLIAVFGFDSARSDMLHSTLSTSIPWMVTTGIAVVLCGLTLGAVTNTLARQLGGDGAWAPTVGLAMLVTSVTDVPRLLFALFLGGGNSFVQLLGWLTWIACGVLMTSMVAKSHDLPWTKALGACSIQLVALLCLFKLPLI
ncbi:Yip1 family protein [Actinacidiphila yeochonensis]|uniref:Yip1 family protein n=1 Tax=Actinacidiphila yeochonensis TaxID=89050 RepID=UPI00068AB5AA|nr:Yip1 family protein [Actinacidiphila yeochonensis]